jgi:hypothetical protein
MPHYFFDLADDEIIHGFKGKQLRDLKQAWEHALVIARDVMTMKASLLREPISDCSVTSQKTKGNDALAVMLNLGGRIQRKTNEKILSFIGRSSAVRFDWHCFSQSQTRRSEQLAVVAA